MNKEFKSNGEHSSVHNSVLGKDLGGGGKALCLVRDGTCGLSLKRKGPTVRRKLPYCK